MKIDTIEVVQCDKHHVWNTVQVDEGIFGQPFR